MLPYISHATLKIASSGGDKAEECKGIMGEKMRSRQGAKLKYTLNDIQKLPNLGGYVDDDTHLIQAEILINPSRSEVIEAIKSISTRLAKIDRKSVV